MDGHPDKVLSTLSEGMVNRKFFKVEVSATPFPEERKEELLRQIAAALGIAADEARYFLSTPDIESNMYNPADDSIEILYGDGSTRGIAEASDMFDIALLSRKQSEETFPLLLAFAGLITGFMTKIFTYIGRNIKKNTIFAF